MFSGAGRVHWRKKKKTVHDFHFRSDGIRKVKEQLKLNLARNVKNKGLYKYTEDRKGREMKLHLCDKYDRITSGNEES